MPTRSAVHLGTCNSIGCGSSDTRKTTQRKPTRSAPQAHPTNSNAPQLRGAWARQRHSSLSTLRAAPENGMARSGPIIVRTQAKAHSVEGSRTNAHSPLGRRGNGTRGMTPPASSTHTLGSARSQQRSMGARAARRHTPTISHEPRCPPRNDLFGWNLTSRDYGLHTLTREMRILPSLGHPIPQRTLVFPRHGRRSQEPPLPRPAPPSGETGRSPHAPPPLFPMRVRGKRSTPGGAY